MSDVLFIQGMGIVSFLLFYFANNLDEEHVFLKLIVNIFALSIILTIPAFMLQSSIAMSLSASLQSLLEKFYIQYLWAIRIFWGYIFVYLNYYFWFKKILVKYKLIKINPKPLKND